MQNIIVTNIRIETILNFFVFYLVGGRWVGNQWVSGEPDGGSGVSDQWLVGQWRAHRWVGGLVVGCRWMG